ncbi:hypothetical protein FAF44_41535 [Nonomuraea sp. MG754425]|uniref:hypothetical protein n=1 Tax=Nonomuraea sp. MG754425 TaxID=2570319 RepID=UPI001F25C7F6|nr:hypothetical protein [Nonomuraea sp. MG754425]MCF6474816.1 hypothetical protein [Nonomuraea sp. MG754425]
MADALLRYDAVTSPTPLQAGGPDKPAANTINLTVTAPAGRTVYCDKIEIAVPVSAPEGGGAYYTEHPSGVITGGKWKPQTEDLKSAQELGMAVGPDTYYLIFEAPPLPDFDLVDGPLTFSIAGDLAAGATGGLLTCQITEFSGTTSGTYSRKDPVELILATAEPPFYLHNFLTVAPDAPTVPRTRFNGGDAVRFTWESNGTSFQLYDGDGTSLWEGPATSCDLPRDTIASDTTYTLKASRTSGDQGGTAYQYATVTVTVTVSAPTLGRLTVTGDLTAGDLTVGLGGANKLTTRGTDGLATTGNLRAGHDLTVSGDLSVSGKTDLSALFETPIELDVVISGGSTQDYYVDRDGILVIQTPSDSGFYADFYVGEGATSSQGGNLLWTVLRGDRSSYTIPLRKSQSWSIFNVRGDATPTFHWIAFS